MVEIARIVAEELNLGVPQVRSALELFAEGATVPFVARYRKERTGGLDEQQLRAVVERAAYLEDLEARKRTVLEAIAAQGKLDDTLRRKIDASRRKQDLEDLYLPYRPKRRTRATMARERGLAPLAEWLTALNDPRAPVPDLDREVARYVDPDQGVATAADALKGAADILAEGIAEQADLRAWLREWFLTSGAFTARVKAEFPAGSTKYESYRDFRAPVRTIAAHSLLALLRGESEGVLDVGIALDEAATLAQLEQRTIRTRVRSVRQFFSQVVRDAFERLIRPSLEGEIRSLKKTEADAESVRAFGENLRELLLAPPAGRRPALGIDPGLRTGCKLAAIDGTGRLVEHATIYPHRSVAERTQAARTLREIVERHRAEVIAIGNGTGGRETEAFVAEALTGLAPQPVRVMVSEAGASVYSASDVAREEFPDLDVSVRGAVSIARRLQDPLAELVKIDPRSLGVGQYQHDVDQKLLHRRLEETVESCVNWVGVDLNTASPQLLTRVSGIGASLARAIVAHRDAHGPFKNRTQLLKVARLGPRAFEQCAGFLRIPGGDNPLDNTAVHPERYSLVKRMATDLGLALTDIPRNGDRLRALTLARYTGDGVGEPTLRDILSELAKPGRDPRESFRYASFREDITEIAHLKPGMALEGVVTNVANFGAFVDVGVHQDGLVHISQLADRFVRDPREVVKVGQVVRVRVLEVNVPLKRISLSMRSSAGNP